MRSRIAVRVVLVASALALLTACNTRPVTTPNEQPAQFTPCVFSQSLNNKADILFMIDNSNSMDAMQASLRQYFPNFMQPLKDLGSKPDLHIGIVTSDLGAGQFSPPSCDTIGGDQGMLQNTPGSTAQCGTGTGQGQLKDASNRFLSYAPAPGGGNAITNFDGDIADAFACYASVGVGGCGFEHQLASVRTALDGCNTDAGCKQVQNQGFFRRDAYLAVVVLTNEDDCSAPSTSQLFDPTQTTLTSELGPLTSYRCFEFGAVCNDAAPGRSQGPRGACEAGNASAKPQYQLSPVDEFATFLKGLKPDPRMVYVSVIAAPPAPVAVGLDSQGYPDLQPSCTGAMGSGDPGIRLAKFVSEFDQDRSSFISICAADLSAAMTNIAHSLALILGSQCIAAPLKDRDPTTPALDLDCVVQDRVPVNAPAGVYEYKTIQPCDEVMCDPGTMGDCACRQHADVGAKGACWYVWQDASCTWPQTAGYQVKIDRGLDATCTNPPAAVGTDALVQCSSCTSSPATGSFDCSAGCRAHWPACCPDPAAPDPSFTPAVGCEKL